MGIRLLLLKVLVLFCITNFIWISLLLIICRRHSKRQTDNRVLKKMSKLKFYWKAMIGFMPNLQVTWIHWMGNVIRINGKRYVMCHSPVGVAMIYIKIISRSPRTHPLLTNTKGKQVNALVPERCCNNYRNIIFNLIVQNSNLVSRC